MTVLFSAIGFGLGYLALAGTSCSVLPLKIALFRVEMAVAVFSVIVKVTKANPVCLTVSLSMGILVLVIGPNLANNASMSFLEVKMPRFWNKDPTGLSGQFGFGQHGSVVAPSQYPFDGGVPLDAYQLTCSLARVAFYVLLGGVFNVPYHLFAPCVTC